MNKSIGFFSYAGLLAFAGLGSVITMFCKAEYQFAVAMLLLVVWMALDMSNVFRTPTKAGVHTTRGSFFFHGLYVLLFMFAMAGNIGYLFYYGYAVLACALVLLCFLQVLDYLGLCVLPDVKNR